MDVARATLRPSAGPLDLRGPSGALPPALQAYDARPAPPPILPAEDGAASTASRLRRFRCRATIDATFAPLHAFSGRPTSTTLSAPSPNTRSATRRASAIVTAAICSVALDEPGRAVAFELDLDELAGDLGRSVEAQGIGADEVFLALLQFVLAEAAVRHVEDFAADDREQFVGAFVLGGGAAVEIGWRDRAPRSRPTPSRRGRAFPSPRGTAARRGRCRRRACAPARCWRCDRGRRAARRAGRNGWSTAARRDRRSRRPPARRTALRRRLEIAARRQIGERLRRRARPRAFRRSRRRRRDGGRRG